MSRAPCSVTERGETTTNRGKNSATILNPYESLWSNISVKLTPKSKILKHVYQRPGWVRFMTNGGQKSSDALPLTKVVDYANKQILNFSINIFAETKSSSDCFKLFISYAEFIWGKVWVKNLWKFRLGCTDLKKKCSLGIPTVTWVQNVKLPKKSSDPRRDLKHLEFLC